MHQLQNGKVFAFLWHCNHGNIHLHVLFQHICVCFSKSIYSTNSLSHVGQVEWPKYYIPAMQIALISDFVDELVVTRRTQGYDPPFIPRLGNLADSVGIKDVTVTNADVQIVIMAQIEHDRRKLEVEATRRDSGAWGIWRNGKASRHSGETLRAPTPPNRLHNVVGVQ